MLPVCPWGVKTDTFQRTGPSTKSNCVILGSAGKRVRARRLAPDAPLPEIGRCMSSSAVAESVPDQKGHFGPYGGRFVPETLMYPLQQLEEEYARAQKDPAFRRELSYYLRE